MKKFIVLRWKNSFRVIGIFLLCSVNKVIFAQNSGNFVVPPCIVNDVELTQEFTGSVSNYGTAYSSCSVTTPNNAVYLGAVGPFSYTVKFSRPVSKVEVILTATGNPGEENFIFNTNGSLPKISSSDMCYSRIEGNEIISGLNSVANGGGGTFLIESSLAFTSLTISGNGGLNGSLLAFSSNSIHATCQADLFIPQLLETKIYTSCETNQADLTKIKALNLPKTLDLTWHSQAVANNENRLKENLVYGGNYYAAFYGRKNNCYSAGTSQIDVIGVALPQIFAGESQRVCKGDSVILQARGGSGYIWDNNMIQNKTFLPEKSMTYSVEGTNVWGCKQKSSVFIQVNELPKVSAGRDLHVFKGEEVKLNGVGAQRFLWNKGVSDGVSFVPDSSAVYIVKGIDQNGCSDLDTVFIEVEEKRIPPLNKIDIGNFDSLYFKPINVVFLVDVSTSMLSHKKIDLMKFSLFQIIKLLRLKDKIALVSYAGEAKVILPSSFGNEKDLMFAEVNHLKASGKTNGLKGIKKGFKLAEKNFIEDGTNMVIILTDGAFNSNKEDYFKLIEAYQQKNIYFSVVGISNSPKDEKNMREAASKGKGVYIPIFNDLDAEQNLVLGIKTQAFKF